MTGQRVIVICKIEVESYRFLHHHWLVGLKLAVSSAPQPSCHRMQQSTFFISTQPGRARLSIPTFNLSIVTNRYRFSTHKRQSRTHRICWNHIPLYATPSCHTNPVLKDRTKSSIARTRSSSPCQQTPQTRHLRIFSSPKFSWLASLCPISTS